MLAFQAGDEGSIPFTRSDKVKTVPKGTVLTLLRTEGNRRVFQKRKRFYVFENPGSGGGSETCVFSTPNDGEKGASSLVLT